MDLCPIDAAHRDVVFNLLIRLIEYSHSNIMLGNILQSTMSQDLQWMDTSLLVIGPWLQKMKRLQVNHFHLLNIAMFLNIVPSFLSYTLLSYSLDLSSFANYTRTSYAPLSNFALLRQQII